MKKPLSIGEVERLLRGTLLEEAKAKPLHPQATKLLAEIEQKAAQRLTHAKQLQEKGQLPEAIEAMTSAYEAVLRSLGFVDRTGP